MKLRKATTPASISFLGKSLIVLTVIVMAFIAPLQSVQKVSADKYDDQINALQQDIIKFQNEAARLNGVSNTLQAELAKLTNEKAAIQAQIALSQAKYNQLSAQIVETEKKIKDNQDALGTTIADLYVDENISPLEMLASSKNISDYLDKQEYRNSVRDQLTDTIKEIKDLRTQLTQQKAEVEKILAEQKGQEKILLAKENEQQTLLAQTQGQEAAFQALSAERTAQMAAVHAQQRAAIAALTNNGSNKAGAVGSFQWRNYSGPQGACGGGYPSKWCTAPLDAYIDDWQLYTRECVSYTAWAAYSRFGKNVTNFSGMGNAYEWPNTTSALMGANVDNTPEVGSIAIAPRTASMPYGHSMVVEEVYGDGWIRVSQYNWEVTGKYSTMDLKASSAVYVHFQNR